MHGRTGNFDRSPNPQGKGVVPVLQDWHALQPAGVALKTPVDFFRDYCISSLVLAADFRFRPVVGRDYYLYSRDQRWSLSLVAPREWGERQPGDYVASCRLRPDMTWDIDFADLEPGSSATIALQAFVEGFVDTLSGQESLEEGLPYFARRLPYYRRVLGAALAKSLHRSMADPDRMLGVLRDQAALPEAVTRGLTRHRDTGAAPR